MSNGADPGNSEVILVIEDEEGIVDFIERGLRGQGFEVLTATDGRAGLELGLTGSIDLVVLDLMLPRLAGLEVLRRLHAAKPALPVIVLTARDGIEDRVGGLDAGAVDYLVKPFSLQELAARIRAQLRAAGQAPKTTLAAGDLEVNLLTRDVLLSGERIRLSTTEFELLVYLVRNQGHVLSREQILRAVWGYDYDPGTNVVDVYIGYLRRKLREASERVTPTSATSPRAASGRIVTVRSVGYRFDGAEA